MTDRDPKPMDPADISIARSFLAGEHHDPPWDGRDGMEVFMCHLLDHADAVKRERDELRVELEIEAELRQRTIAERNAVQAKLAEHGVHVDIDADVLRHRDRMSGLETSTDEWRLRLCENELTKALGLPDHDGWDSLLEAVQAKLAEATRLRARVRVEAEDVERAGVTHEHAEAWLTAQNWVCERGQDGSLVCERGDAAILIADTIPWREHASIADGINALVRHYSTGIPELHKCGLDILDEMAAMPLADR